MIMTKKSVQPFFDMVEKNDQKLFNGQSDQNKKQM